MRSKPRLVGVARDFSVYVELEQANEGEKLCFRDIYVCISDCTPQPQGYDIYIIEAYAIEFKGS